MSVSFILRQSCNRRVYFVEAHQAYIDFAKDYNKDKNEVVGADLVKQLKAAQVEMTEALFTLLKGSTEMSDKAKFDVLGEQFIMLTREKISVLDIQPSLWKWSQDFKVEDDALADLDDAATGGAGSDATVAASAASGSAGKKKRADGEAVPAPGPSSAKVAKSVKIELAEPVIKKMKAEPTEEATKPARPQGRKRRAP